MGKPRRTILWATAAVVLVIALPFVLYLIAWFEFVCTGTGYAESVLQRMGLMEWLMRVFTG
jgi:hypothetical protein